MSFADLERNLSRAEQRVQSLVVKYRATGDAYHPRISKILAADKDYDMVWMLLDHEAQLISQRPTGLAFHEISVVQKAFLELFADENLIPALNLYTCEILGLGDSDKTNEDITLSVQKRLYLMHKLKESHRQERDATQSPHGSGAHPNTPKKRSTRKSKKASAPAPNEQKDDLNKATQHAETTQGQSKEHEPDEHLSRLLEKFQQARSEFDTARPRSFQQTRSARFLRDTTENCLNYLRSKHAIDTQSKTIPSDVEVSYDKDVVTELFNVLSEATRVAERGSGGKKRRFDMSEQERAAAAEAFEAREARESHEAHETLDRSKQRRFAEDYHNNPRTEEYHSNREVEDADLNEEYDPRKPYLVDTRHHQSRNYISPNYRGRNPRPAPITYVSAHEDPRYRISNPRPAPTTYVSAHEDPRYRISKPRHRRRNQRSASPRRSPPRSPPRPPPRPPPGDPSLTTGRSRDGPFVPVPEVEEDRRGMGYMGKSSRYRSGHNR